MAVDLPVGRSGKSAEEVVRSCAQEASDIIMARFGQHHNMLAKGRRNYVTETDLAAERAVLDILRREYPEHEVLSEETTSDAKRTEGWLWVVDPLDGTHNFSQGIPHFAVSIALCLNSDPVLGLTYSPATNLEFLAAKGKGFRVNGEPARVSGVTSVKQAVLGVDLGYNDERAARLIAMLGSLWPGMQAVRLMGSATLGLAYAASGRFDLFVHHYLFPWDLAAGIVMLREAGGVIIDRDGGPASVHSEGIIGGAAAVVRDFMSIVQDNAGYWGDRKNASKG